MYKYVGIRSSIELLCRNFRNDLDGLWYSFIIKMTSLNGLIWIFISSNIVFAFSVRFPVNFTRRTSTDEYQLIAAHVVRMKSVDYFRIWTTLYIELIRSEFLWIWKNVQLMRHGDRNIVRSFPNNRYADKIYWPGGYGALTMVSATDSVESEKWK